MAIVDDNGLLRAVEVAAEEAELAEELGDVGRQVIQSSEEASRRGWNVAISNPCFEVWLLLHFSSDLATINDYGDSVEAVLRSALGSYDKCRTPAQCLNAEALLQAIASARLGDTEPANPIPRLPGTRVYRLFDSIFKTQAPGQSA
ncbi:MAG: RloB family protein [Byssovorax sp.]